MKGERYSMFLFNADATDMTDSTDKYKKNCV